MTVAKTVKPFLNERGSVLTLGIGLFIVVVALCSIGADVSSVWVTRHGLDSMADGAALSAAQAVDQAYVYKHGLKNPVFLSQTLAKKRVNAYLKSANAKSRFSGFRVLSVTVSQTRVHVELQARADIPFGYLLPPRGSVVNSAADAQLILK